MFLPVVSKEAFMEFVSFLVCMCYVRKAPYNHIVVGLCYVFKSREGALHEVIIPLPLDLLFVGM